MTPFIVTFYSYKGGVGRSLLAANIGVLTARRGKTLLWDLDIEAPGLHNIPGLTPSKPVKEGFFEWMISWQKSGKASNKADFSKLVKLACQTPERDRLFILPAYGDNKDFAGLFQSIRWDDFLVRDLDSGLALFRGILDAFGKAGFETVLLDSRTGITDIGGLLAALLPHATVLAGNYGRQNTRGLAHVWQALQPASEGRVAARGTLPPLTRLLVASPIADELDLRAKGEDIWKEAFGLAPTELVTIPFDQRLLFTEELYAATRPDTPVAKAYNDLERRIDKVRQQVIAESESVRRSDDARPDLVVRRNKDRHEQGKSFEERVAHLLRLLGYAVEREQLIDSNRVDLVARKRADFGREELYLVECKDHQSVIPKETLQIFKTWLDGPTASQMQARGMVVAARDFSPAARSFAREQGIQALTYDELERSLFDFSPYLARIRQRYEASALASNYVDQYLILEKQPDEKPVLMLPHALEWVSGTGSRLWLVLGDYGTGKSTLVERLAYELARNCENNPESPIPVEINLRQFPNAISLESLIREHLEAELRTVLNPEIVLHLLEAGRVVLLLDSFDEMGVAQAGRSVEEQFRQLARPTANPGRNPRGNRVLITSRSHFFRDSSSARQAVQGGDKLFEADSALGKAARAFDATLDTLPVFTKEQIAEYLQKRLGMVEGDQARRFIEERYGLQDIASTPQLLDMIVASLPDLIKKGEKVTTGSLYLTYTTRWLNTIRLNQGEVNVDHMRDLLERMACELWSRPRNQIHYTDLAVLLHHEGGLARSLDSERVDLELRTASFLVRSADGYYRFSHRSFLEFFFARALFRALKDGDFAKTLACGRVNPEATTFLLDLTESTPEISKKLTIAIRTILTCPYTEVISENALLIAYRAALYRVKALLINSESIKIDNFSAAQQLLIPPGAQLNGAQLAGEDLGVLRAEDINFRGADLSHIQLSIAWLKGACFDGGRLDGAQLNGAIMEGASLIGTSALRICGQDLNLNRANCSNAVFDGADLRFLQACDTDFSGASLRLTRLAEARLDNANLATTDLSGATWPRANGFTENIGLSPLNPRIAGLIGHSGRILACDFSPDGKRILTVGSDRTGRLWDAQSGKEIRRFEGHSGRIQSCAFSPDGKGILTAGEDHTVRLWEVESGKEIRRFEGHSGRILACTFSPDGKRILTAGSDRTARLWDAETGIEIRRFEGDSGEINSCSVSPDGKFLLIAGDDRTAQLWDAKTGKEIRRFAVHFGELNASTFSPDGKRILTAGSDRTARLWDAESGKEIRRFEGHAGRIQACAFSIGGKRILTASDDSTARLWDTESGKEIRRFEGHSGRILACVFSPDGKSIITAGDDRTALLREAESGKELRRFEGHAARIRAGSFSPDGKCILTAGDDSIARLWDAESYKEIRRFEGHSGFIRACAFSPDGEHILTAGYDGTVRLWDAETGKELRRFEGHFGEVNACVFSPDGKRILTSGDDSTARLWDGDSDKELRRFEGHSGRILACALSPDGKCILTAGDDSVARLWDAVSGKELRRFEGHSGRILACALSPDGKRILTAGDDSIARLWDGDSGKELRRFQGHFGELNACAFSADSKRILTSGDDSAIRLWDVDSGKEVRRFKGHSGLIRACAFSPDGQRILTAGDDSTARFWDANSGVELFARSAAGNSWVLWLQSEGLWDGEGELTEWLRYEDESEVPTGDPDWVPRHWLAADLPELRGLTSLSQMKLYSD
jgi:WD40 repeat protein/uncharacterized protein YjbI with pentapeptide repeats